MDEHADRFDALDRLRSEVLRRKDDERLLLRAVQ
jgi:hypothetical protein